MKENRIYDPNTGNHSRSDGSLQTNAIKLEDKIDDLINKIDGNRDSDSDVMAKAFGNIEDSE